MKDVFISHAWGTDLYNRNNHQRCKILCDKLIEEGFKVWFDSYDMRGNIDKSIMKGINNSSAVIVCLTNTYVNKINEGVILNKINDNCFKEWNYSLFKNKIIIPVIMEEEMHDIWEHNGVLQLYLRSVMYLDILTDDYENNDFKLLCKTLRGHGLNNSRTIYRSFSNNSFNSIAEYFKKLSPRKLTSQKKIAAPIKKFTRFRNIREVIKI